MCRWDRHVQVGPTCAVGTDMCRWDGHVQLGSTCAGGTDMCSWDGHVQVGPTCAGGTDIAGGTDMPCRTVNIGCFKTQKSQEHLESSVKLQMTTEQWLSGVTG
jgi:hypothetical protein